MGRGDPGGQHQAVGTHASEVIMSTAGGTPLSGSSADFGKLIIEEAGKWEKVVKFVGIKAN
jgi:hypothetical protein